MSEANEDVPAHAPASAGGASGGAAAMPNGMLLTAAPPPSPPAARLPLGISLAGFNALIAAHGGRAALRGVTTGELKTRIVLPYTAHTRTSYAAQLVAVGSPLVREAQVFISHAYSDVFLAVVDAVAAWEEKDAAARRGTFYYFDLLIVNQHGQDSKVPFEVLRREFGESVRAIGRTLLMLRWEEPVPLKRAWCVFEIATSLHVEAGLEVIMPPEDRHAFLAELQRDIFAVSQRLCIVDVERASAHVPEDLLNIQRVIKEGVGFLATNQKVIDRLFAWMDEEGQSALDSMAPENGDARFLSPLAMSLLQLRQKRITVKREHWLPLAQEIYQATAEQFRGSYDSRDPQVLRARLFFAEDCVSSAEERSMELTYLHSSGCSKLGMAHPLTLQIWWRIHLDNIFLARARSTDPDFSTTAQFDRQLMELREMVSLVKDVNPSCMGSHLLVPLTPAEIAHFLVQKSVIIRMLATCLYCSTTATGTGTLDPGVRLARLEESRAMLEEHCRETFDPTDLRTLRNLLDPNSMRDLRQLARVYSELGKEKEAVELLEHAHSIFLRVYGKLGEDQFHTALLCGALLKLGQRRQGDATTDAAPHFERVRELCEETANSVWEEFSDPASRAYGKFTEIYSACLHLGEALHGLGEDGEVWKKRAKEIRGKMESPTGRAAFSFHDWPEWLNINRP